MSDDTSKIQLPPVHADIENLPHSMRAFVGGPLAENYHWAYFQGSHHGQAHVGLDCKFLDCNPAFCRMVKRTYPELMNLTFGEITEESFLHQDVDQAEAMIRGVIDNYAMDKSYIGPRGEEIPVYLTVKRIPASSSYEFQHFKIDIYPRTPLSNIKSEVTKTGKIQTRTTTSWLDFVKDNPVFVLLFLLFIILGGHGEKVIDLIGKLFGK